MISHPPLISQMKWKELEQCPSFHLPLEWESYIIPHSSLTLLGSPECQSVKATCVPSTHSQRDLSLGFLCKPIHAACDILGESACCSACDVTIASLDPSASQAAFAAFQFNFLDEILKHEPRRDIQSFGHVPKNKTAKGIQSLSDTISSRFHFYLGEKYMKQICHLRGTRKLTQRYL